MDLLAKRYANPSFLLCGYIRAGRLVEFINEVAQLTVEEKAWDFFLHKVWDISWEEYRARAVPEPAPVITSEELEATVSESYSMLQNFNPL